MMKARLQLNNPSVDEKLKASDLLADSYLLVTQADLSDLVKYDGIRNWKTRAGA